jgi:hypothetical protein
VHAPGRLVTSCGAHTLRRIDGGLRSGMIEPVSSLLLANELVFAFVESAAVNPIAQSG